MGVGVGHVAANGLAQPVERRLVIAIEQIGVAEIELIVGCLGVGVSRAGQKVGRRSGIGRGAAPQLHDAKVVEDGREMRRRRRGGCSTCGSSSRVNVADAAA